ncbi:MAG: biopolymer transporter ExbD [Selenomonadaceae bacterium]|nr:biopolymer transporter ExbD [Selenomonadaceae bacterium]
MRRRDFREKKLPLVMIIPMIDIMLFLLVFFMLSTIYMVQTNNFNVNLPQTEGEKQEVQPKFISITVTESGEIFFEDSKVLAKNLPQLVNHALTKERETIFVIYGDKSARYEKIVGVLELLKKSGARHISVATEFKY